MAVVSHEQSVTILSDPFSCISGFLWILWIPKLHWIVVLPLAVHCLQVVSSRSPHLGSTVFWGQTPGSKSLPQAWFHLSITFSLGFQSSGRGPRPSLPGLKLGGRESWTRSGSGPQVSEEGRTWIPRQSVVDEPVPDTRRKAWGTFRETLVLEQQRRNDWNKGIEIALGRSDGPLWGWLGWGVKLGLFSSLAQSWNPEARTLVFLCPQTCQLLPWLTALRHRLRPL